MELVNFQLHRADMPIRFIAKPPSAADLGKQLKKKKKWMDRWFKRKKKTKGERNDILFLRRWMGGIWLSVVNRRNETNHTHTDGRGLKVEECMPGVWTSGEGDEWNSTVASVFLGGSHTATQTHTRGPAKGLKQPQTSECSKYRRIDRICGKVQPGDWIHTPTQSASYAQQII